MVDTATRRRGEGARVDRVDFVDGMDLADLVDGLLREATSGPTERG
jgi:hypothetical protein